MGLDMYAGTLTRYYSKNWKTVAQQLAEENGFRFETVRPNTGSSQGEELPVEAIQEAMRQWSAGITDALRSTGGVFDVWEENNEQPYYTDKPDWSAFGALLLYGACLHYSLPLPQKIEKGWEYQKDPIVARALEDSELNGSLFSFTEWWLPFDTSIVFRCQAPTGNEMQMGTTGTLLAELRKINALAWNADDATILGWRDTEGYPADAKIADGVYEEIAENDAYDVESLAKFAFSIFYRAALFSKKHAVPILMDY